MLVSDVVLFVLTLFYSDVSAYEIYRQFSSYEYAVLD